MRPITSAVPVLYQQSGGTTVQRRPCARGEAGLLSLFADDVTILSRHVSREEAAKEAQWAVDIVAEWSSEWKLGLNASKSEVAFFSTWSKEASHSPSLTIAGEPVPFNPTPKLLGVTFDRQLSFDPHVKAVTKAATGKTKLLAAVGNTEWGWNKEHLKQLYFAYVRSKIDYCGPGWQPWLPPSNIKLMEITQNKAIRTIPSPDNSNAAPRRLYTMKLVWNATKPASSAAPYDPSSRPKAFHRTTREPSPSSLQSPQGTKDGAGRDWATISPPYSFPPEAESSSNRPAFETTVGINELSLHLSGARRHLQQRRRSIRSIVDV